ncbi:MAG: glycoside hydrolase, partial [Clostridia bacterium]|nr:glycoside hydrolase [Clostridia bacterium]
TNFHGGFGLLNLQGIPKPSYFAYRFLAMLGNTRLFCPDENTLATQSHNGYQLLTWNCDNFQEEENILYFGRDVPPEKQEVVTLTLQNPLPGNYRAKLYAVGHGINDPYTIFLHTEYVDSLSREQVRKLKEQTDGRPIWEATLALDGSPFSKTIPLRTNDVYLLTLERI